MTEAAPENLPTPRKLAKLLIRLPGARLLLSPDESRLVLAVLRFDPTTPRVMIDVGAHVGSTLLPFAHAGFRVLAYEPDSANRDALTKACRGLAQVEVRPHAVSDCEADSAPFFTSPESTGISGLSAFHASHRQNGQVRLVTLGAELAARGIDDVGFLKVDCEGHDLFVLQGAALSRIRPRVIMCEFEDRKTVPLGYDWQVLAKLLLEHGYVVLVSEWYPVERYGAAHRWRSLKRYPTTLTDPQAFGNLIAVQEERIARVIGTLGRLLGPSWRLGSRAQGLLQQRT